MARRRSPSNAGRRTPWLRPRRSPPLLFRRRRQTIVGLIVALAALAVGDRVYRSKSAESPPPLGGDLGRYHGQVFRVTEVVDGDTLHIDVPDGTRSHTKIRLWGVDTPEVHGVDRPAHFGPEASAFSHAVAEGQLVRLELLPKDTRDRYQRLLAYVYLPDGTMLNERLIEEGYAFADTRFAHPFKAKFTRLERRARESKVGLWSNISPDRMPHWRRELELSRRRSGACLPPRQSGRMDGDLKSLTDWQEHLLATAV